MGLETRLLWSMDARRGGSWNPTMLKVSATSRCFTYLEDQGAVGGAHESMVSGRALREGSVFTSGLL